MGKFSVELNTDMEELNEIFEKEEGDVMGAAPYLLGKFFGGLSRIAVYGFLLARAGVPFLPHDNGAALAVTIVAALLVSLPVRKLYAQYALIVAVVAFVAFFLVLRMDGHTTSIVLVGTVITAISQASDSYPFVYGFVFGGALVAIAVQVFNLEPFFHPHQLLLSHERWTPDRAGHQGLLLVAMLLLSALINLGHQETKRVREKVKAAVAARDAAVVDERARIARELHDVVSHHVTAMTLQAEAAAMTGDKDALSAVATAGRDALTELRRMLGVLRRPDNEDASLDPQPDMSQLDALANRTSSGPRVHVDRRGDVRPLSAGLELGVYRLVQEALTNSAKHSDATTVDVVLDYGESELTVEVLDNGRPLVAARVGSGGLGLVGMQERIALLNGELTTGPRTGATGFRVFARVPIEQ